MSTSSFVGEKEIEMSLDIVAKISAAYIFVILASAAAHTLWQTAPSSFAEMHMASRQTVALQ
ncbi:hypothetical protein ACQ3G6_07230 [Allorhizobium undicola]|uniref:hypothetical protein n=1 Tax=Allorhizobium undicola TaxID=78527 RepID=UPI003D32B678